LVVVALSVFPEISLRVIVGELLPHTKMPPPTAAIGLDVHTYPLPPVMWNPSIRSEVVGPTPPMEVACTAAHDVVAALTVQSDLMHGLPLALIVVTDGPSVETTLIPAKMRMASA